MDLATTEVHRSLEYLVALNAQGYQPTVQEFEEYATRPDRRPARQEPVFAAVNAFQSLLQATQALVRQVEPSENYPDFFQRLRWATIRDGRMTATTLGKAFYRALEQQSSEGDSSIDVILEAKDNFAFTRVVGRIADLGRAMLVEPYFRLDVLMPIVEFTEITRVLTSERTAPNDRSTLRLAVERITLDRPFEIRVATREVHDRYVIPDVGSVEFMGASLNGLGQVSTAMGRMTDGSDQLRQLYENIWESSSVLVNARASEEAEAMSVSAPLRQETVQSSDGGRTPGTDDSTGIQSASDDEIVGLDS